MCIANATTVPAWLKDEKPLCFQCSEAISGGAPMTEEMGCAGRSTNPLYRRLLETGICPFKSTSCPQNTLYLFAKTTK
jgi:hypothetical protein